MLCTKRKIKQRLRLRVLPGDRPLTIWVELKDITVTGDNGGEPVASLAVHASRSRVQIVREELLAEEERFAVSDGGP